MKNTKRVLSLALASCMVAAPITAFAQTTGYVMQDATNNNFQFDLEKLGDSYDAWKANPESPQAAYFLRYIGMSGNDGNPVGYIDDVRGYIDFNDISDAYDRLGAAGIVAYMENTAKRMAAGTNITPVDVKEDGSIEEKDPIVVEDGQQGEVTVVSVSTVADKNVKVGTAVDALELPTEVEVTLNDEAGTKKMANVDWDKTGYDGNTAGNYTLTGTLTAKEGDTYVIPADMKATIKVVVANETVDIGEVLAAVNGATSETIVAVLEEKAAALGMDLTSFNTLEDTYKTEVGEAVLKGKVIQPTGKYADAVAIKTAFDNAVAYQIELQAKVKATEAVNAVLVEEIGDDATEEEIVQSHLNSVYEMEKVLKENAGIIGIEFTDYDKLIDFMKCNIIEMMLLDGPNEKIVYENTDEIKEKFNQLVSGEHGLLNILNEAIKQVNDVDTKEEMMDALCENGIFDYDLRIIPMPYSEIFEKVIKGYKHSEFIILPEYFQIEVADAVLAARPKDKGYVDFNEIKVAFDKAVEEQKVEAVKAFVKYVNEVQNADNMKDLLGDEEVAIILGLDLTVYNKLGTAYQTAVAQAVLDGKGIQAGAKYATAEAIKAAFNVAVAAQETGAVNDVVRTVNEVPAPAGEQAADNEGTAMQTVLTNNATTLGLVINGDESVYAVLTTPGKLAVAKAVLENRPETGYASTTAVKAAFDAAVTAQKDMEDADALKTAINVVNTATAQNMKTGLENNAEVLGLETGEASAYTALSPAGKTYVAQQLIDERLLQPDQKYADKDAIKAAFDAAVAYRTDVEAGGAVVASIAAVNGANAETMQAVLQNNATALGLAVGTEENQTDYYKLRTNFKEEVASAVLEAKPEGNYATKGQIVDAFNAAVAAQKAAQGTENAAIDAVNNVKAAAADATDAQKAAAQDAMLQALLAKKDVLKLTKLDSYNALSLVAQRLVAKAVFTAKPQNGFAYDGGAVAIKTAFENAIDTQGQAQTSAVNAINSAASSTVMVIAIKDNAAILALDVTQFNNFEDSVQNQIAQVVIDGKLAQENKKYANAAAIKPVFNSAVAAVLAENGTEKTILDAVNGATEGTIMDVLTQYKANLDLDMSTYSDLGDTYKQAVAKAIVEAKPEDGYKTFAAIKDKFNNAVASQVVMVAVDKVNDAVTVEATKTALEYYQVLLGIDETWNALSEPQKTEVATKVKNGKVVQPTGRYTSAEAIQAVVTNAVDTGTPTITDARWVTLPQQEEDAVAATGTIIFTDVQNDNDKVVFGGTTFTKVASDPTGNQYTNADELAALINGLDNVSAANESGTITVTAETAGAAGNDISYILNGGSAVNLTGGKDLVQAENGVFTLTFSEAVQIDGALTITFDSSHALGTVVSAPLSDDELTITVTVNVDDTAMGASEQIVSINVKDLSGIAVDIEVSDDKLIDEE